jgi:hypothetical protein
MASSFANNCSAGGRISATLAEAIVRVYAGEVEEGLGLSGGALDHARAFVPALREACWQTSRCSTISAGTTSADSAP